MELSFRKILRKEKDEAGKWLVWVEVADGEAVILKFHENPTTTRVRDEVLKYIDNKLKEKENGTPNA